MIANLHTHTPRCRHAKGSEREYVQAAIDGGLQVLGFSDHAPQFFDGDYYSKMRMYPQELADYARDIRALQTEFAGKIEIFLGLEVEYYPDIFEKLLNRSRECGIEYMILGQHWIENEIGQTYLARPTEDESVLERYCKQTVEALRTGLFTYFAHPDIVNFQGDAHLYETQMRFLCREAKAMGVPLEINLEGMRTGKNYPEERFWRIAGEVGNAVVLGADCHLPQGVTGQDRVAPALQMARRCGLQVLDRVQIVRI